jgi:hypothetical protein
VSGPTRNVLGNAIDCSRSSNLSFKSLSRECIASKQSGRLTVSTMSTQYQPKVSSLMTYHGSGNIRFADSSCVLSRQDRATTLESIRSAVRTGSRRRNAAGSVNVKNTCWVHIPIAMPTSRSFGSASPQTSVTRSCGRRSLHGERLPTTCICSSPGSMFLTRRPMVNRVESADDSGGSQDGLHARVSKLSLSGRPQEGLRNICNSASVSFGVSSGKKCRPGRGFPLT